MTPKDPPSLTDLDMDLSRVLVRVESLERQLPHLERLGERDLERADRIAELEVRVRQAQEGLADLSYVPKRLRELERQLTEARAEAHGSVLDLEPGQVIGLADDGEAPSDLHARLSRLEGAVAELQDRVGTTRASERIAKLEHAVATLERVSTPEAER